MDAFVSTNGNGPKTTNIERDLGLDLLMNRRKVAGPNSSGGSDRDSVRSFNVIDVGEHMMRTRPPQRFDQEADEVEDYDDDARGDEDDDGGYDDDDVAPMRPPPPRMYPPPSHHARGPPVGAGGGGDAASVVSFGQISARSMSQAGRFRPVHPGSAQDNDAAVVAQKKELLYQFDRMEKKGMVLPRKFTLSSNLEDMKSEYERLKRDKEIDASIKTQRRILMAVASGLEWVNNKFDPVGAKLDGWSDSLYENITDYDDVFEELHDKYKTSAQLPPELKLMMMMSGSAFMHHMTHTMFKSQLPGLDDILRQNPDLAKNLATATSEHMAHQQSSAGNLFGSLGGMFSGMFGGGGGPSGTAPPPPSAAPSSGGGGMKGPANVDDIMREFAGMSTAAPTSTAPDISVNVVVNPSDVAATTADVIKDGGVPDELDMLERLADAEAANIVGGDPLVGSAALAGDVLGRSMTLDI